MELKPCPFNCNGTIKEIFYSSTASYHVEHNCRILGRVLTRKAKTREQAAKAWNTRKE